MVWYRTVVREAPLPSFLFGVSPLKAPCFLAWLMAAMEAPTGECCGKPRMRVCG